MAYNVCAGQRLATVCMYQWSDEETHAEDGHCAKQVEADL
jgi:hypothetical protein